jgi:Methyltransferase domain
MDKKKIQHLQYDEKLYNPEDYHQSICKLLLKAGKELDKEKNDLTIVDVGSGHGTLMKMLKDNGYQKISGMDIDKKCVEMSSRFGTCVHAGVDEIDTVIHEKKDVIILAHVLEHLENPRLSLEKIKKKCAYLILIVPNPSRIKVMLRHNLFARDYSNKGHYYCWDRSHFSNFLRTYCDLELLKWEIDRVYLVPFKFFRRIYRWIRLLDLLEKKLLTKWFPYFSDSLIVLCKPKGD